MLTRFDPTQSILLDRELDTLRGTLHRFFGDLGGELTTSTLHPAADVVEDANGYRIQVELPGMQKDAFKITVQDNAVVLQGEKRRFEEKHEGNVWRTERAYGSFSRRFAFGDRIDANHIKANYRDGVLEISVPKAEEARPRNIEVQVS